MSETTVSHISPAIIRIAQYFSGLTPGQDEWEEMSRALATFLDIAAVAFARGDTGGEMRFHHWTLSAERDGADMSGIETQLAGSAAEVCAHGFLSTCTVASPEDMSFALLPVGRT